MNILSIQNISKSYKDYIALDNINLEIPTQTIFGLLGPNGAGKTTLIRIITQIIISDSGKVLFDGKEMTSEMVRKIGYLPEERGLYKRIKIGEQLLYLAQLKGMTRSDAIDKIRKWLKKLDIYDWVDKSIEDLSKGMAQKIQFIATVVHEPKLLILDEPFSGFDPVNTEIIKKEILNLKEQGTTIIFSTHRMETVEELCENIALIHKSKKILDGTKKEIKDENREGIYVVSFIGNIEDNHAFDVIERNPTIQNDLNYALIKSKIGIQPNQILENLIKTVEVHSFVEKIPSMNDIFISKVKNYIND